MADLTRPCFYCSTPVRVLDTSTYRLVTGWAQRKKSSGANSVRMAKPRDFFAHASCVDLAVKGKIGQDTLFPDED